MEEPINQIALVPAKDSLLLQSEWTMKLKGEGGGLPVCPIKQIQKKSATEDPIISLSLYQNLVSISHLKLESFGSIPLCIDEILCISITIV
jgi:hypothetical protein